MEKELRSNDIEVIFGETDVSYSISSVNDGDYLIILDAAGYGNPPGYVTSLPLSGFNSIYKDYSQHSFNFLDLLKLYHPEMKGIIFAIEISEIKFHYGLSLALADKVSSIAQNILNQINNISGEMYCT
jgi:hydrogenase maturation protease